MNTPDSPLPADQPDGPDPLSETGADAGAEDRSSQAPDETLAEMMAAGAEDSAGETTADFGPGWKDNLVAYLDGELNEQDMQELDEVLVQQPDARANVEQLRQTWDLLDVLPRPAVTEEFSAQTMATIQVIRDEEPPPPSPWPRRGLLAIAWALVLSVSGAAGVLLADRWQPDPTRMLIAQLSVVERLETYREIGDLEFIKALADTERFPRDNELDEPITGNSILLTTIPAEPAKRRTYISDLPLDRRKRLTRNREDFSALAAARQSELIQLDVEISQSPGLARVAADFHGWLRTLRPWQRDEIRKTTTGASDKITLVLEYLDEQQEQQKVRSLGGPQAAAALGQGPSLSSEDFARVLAAIEQRLSPAQKKQLGEQAELKGTARAILVLELSTSLAAAAARPPATLPPASGRTRARWPGPELGLAIFEAIQSDEVRGWLEQTDGTEPRRLKLGLMVIRGLVYASFREIRNNRPSERDLQEHFVGLSREKQDELMRLPPSESKRRLRQSLYQQNNPDAIASPLQLYRRYFRLLGRIRTRRGSAGGGSGAGGPGNGPGRPARKTSAEPPATRPPGGTR